MRDITRTKKVLVVDDDDGIRSLCTEVLGVAGYEVDTATNGMEAIDKVKNATYGLVISDIDMPELDGLSFYAYALRDHGYLRDRFLFISGCLPDEVRGVLERLKVRCMAKPFRIRDFLNVVEEMMSGVVEDTDRKGPDGKRREDRFSMVAQCNVKGVLNGTGDVSVVSARVQNLSRGGVKLRFAGHPIVPSREVALTVNVNALNVRRGARVVWSRHISEMTSEAGLVFERPMPVTSLMNLYPVKL